MILPGSRQPLRARWMTCFWRCSPLTRTLFSLPERDLPATVTKFAAAKPTAVILSIEEYRKLLERVEDAEDLKTLRAMRKRPLRFRKLEDFLKDSAGV